MPGNHLSFFLYFKPPITACGSMVSHFKQQKNQVAAYCPLRWTLPATRLTATCQILITNRQACQQFDCIAPVPLVFRPIISEGLALILEYRYKSSSQ